MHCSRAWRCCHSRLADRGGCHTPALVVTCRLLDAAGRRDNDDADATLRHQRCDHITVSWLYVTSVVFISLLALEDPDTRGITRVAIRTDGRTLFVHMWGSCTPTDCDWGETTTAVADAQDGALSLRWTFSFKVDTQTLTVLADGRLRVRGHTHFTDNSGRADYDYTYFYRKQAPIN